jgi:uncharacterized protein YgiM (DUF1202 family)
MLGRYVTGTLLILLVAMLVAPEAEEPTAKEAPDVAARAETDPAALDAANTERAGRALSDDLADGGTAPSEGARHERLVRTLLDMEPRSMDAPADRSGGAWGDTSGPPLPTLSEPDTLRRAAVSQETQRLIDRSEHRASDAPTEADAPADADSLPRRYVTGSRVNLRAGPSTEFDILTSLAYGAEVDLLAAPEASWARIRAADGTEGFMSRRFLAEELEEG